MSALVTAWDRAVHEPQPVIGLAVFRIAFGLVVLLTLLLVLPDAGVWFGARGVLSPEGRHLGTIVTPKHPHNFAWGGDDGKTLYICARSGLYRMRLNIEGVRP